ncbi:hypothetical protein M2156_006742 [Streptomyces sp. SAI-149]|jgi:hypothetical protein|nr:hypothetical protein [Streptomyces sp. SAI-119]MDH6500523.1 hypothetical protein [Streptomyces sp. SAI-149]
MDARNGIGDETRPAALEGLVRPSRSAGLPGAQEAPVRPLRGSDGALAEVLS